MLLRVLAFSLVTMLVPVDLVTQIHRNIASRYSWFSSSIGPKRSITFRICANNIPAILRWGTWKDSLSSAVETQTRQRWHFSAFSPRVRISSQR